MTCEICGLGMRDGVTLHRQNEKGVKGVWRCFRCNVKLVDPVVLRITQALNGPRVGRQRRIGNVRLT